MNVSIPVYVYFDKSDDSYLINFLAIPSNVLNRGFLPNAFNQIPRVQLQVITKF